jgi:hypothetical protein
MEHQISVDVYADWHDTPPRYRIYVDNDLLTERDFIWDTSMYISEKIIVKLEPGNHELRVEQVNTAGSIRTDNVLVDNVASSMVFITT